MPDIRVIKTNPIFCTLESMSPEGKKWLERNLENDPAVRRVEYIEDLIEHIKSDGLEVDI